MRGCGRTLGRAEVRGAVDHDSISATTTGLWGSWTGARGTECSFTLWIALSCSTGRSFTGPEGGDYPDNAERFGLSSRAVLEATKLLGVPDVFHVHDWQSGDDSGLSADHVCRRPGAAQSGGGADDSQRGLPGAFPPATTESCCCHGTFSPWTRWSNSTGSIF